MSAVQSTWRITIETKNSGSKTFMVGLAVSHVYGVEVNADSHDLALLKMDSWLRGHLPADTLLPKIRSSDVQVIGLGAVVDGTVAPVGDISADTRAEMAARGKLPDSGWAHLLPVPPGGNAQDEKAAPSIILTR